MAHSRYDPSADRRELNKLCAEFASILDAFCGPEWLVRGRLSALKRRCGKEGCRCTRGKLHESTVLVDRRDSSRRVLKVNLAQYRKLKKPTRQDRVLRRLRARLSALQAEVLERCDRLRQHRLAKGQKLLQRIMKE